MSVTSGAPSGADKVVPARIPWAVPAVILGLVLLGLYRGYAGDDTYIHLQYARNIGAGLGFSFNPGEPSYGTTAPLWTAMLAGLGHPAGDVYLVAKGLSVAAALGSIFVFFVLARQVLRWQVTVVAATLAFAVDPWLLKWGGSGMETSLAVMAALAATSLHLKRRERGGLPASAFILGMGTMLRPELVGLFLIGVFDRLVLARRPLSEVGVAVICYIAPILPWVLYSFSAFGDVIPATVHAKAGHMPRAEVLVRTVKVLGATYWPMLLAMVLAVPLVGRRGLEGVGWWNWVRANTMLWGWAVGLPVAYLITRSYVASRYLLLSSPMLLLLGFVAVEVLTRSDRGRLRLAVLLVLLFAATSAAIQATVIYPRTRFTRGVDDRLIGVGVWLAERTPEDVTVAVHEVGAVGFFCQRRVIDTAGLVTRESLPYVMENRVPELLVTLEPEYYVSSGDDRVDQPIYRALGERMTLVYETEVQRGGSSPLFAHPLPVGIYRFDWSGPPAAPPAWASP